MKSPSHPREDDPFFLRDIDLIQEYQIYALHHITKLSNLKSIFQYGLLSHRKAHSQVNSHLLGLCISDISDADVQKVRKTKLLNHRSLQEYVCLYFNPRNPMLFKRQDQQEDLVILGVEPLLLLEKDVYFSDGNAAAQLTQFYNDLSQLNQVNWEIVRADFWSDQLDGKRIRCSEILAPFTVSVEKIKKVFCYNTKQVQQIEIILQELRKEKNLNISICLEVKTSLYF